MVRKQPFMLITLYESTFNANDGKHFIWIHPDYQLLRKKGRGQALHVSDFLTPIGCLEDGDGCVIMKYGGEIWSTSDELLEQVIDKAIPTFET